MKKFLFVCHGNICRSPLAEFVFKNITKGEDYIIDSKALSTEELGNPIYPPSKEQLIKNNIPFEDHRSTEMTREDLDYYDYIVYMDQRNLKLLNLLGKSEKIHRLLDFTSTPHDIEDPWYTGNFEKVFDEIMQGCKGLYDFVKNK